MVSKVHLNYQIIVIWIFLTGSNIYLHYVSLPTEGILNGCRQNYCIKILTAALQETDYFPIYSHTPKKDSETDYVISFTIWSYPETGSEDDYQDFENYLKI